MATDLNTLTYGIEIETTIASRGPRGLDANNWQVGSYHQGWAIPDFDFAGKPWLTKHDGSLRANYPRVGVEFVSPVLAGTDGLHNVKAMVEKLVASGAKVNASCGLHVHVGWTGNAKQLRRLICLVAQHEKALYASTGTTSRETGIYCRSIKGRLKPLEQMRQMHDLQSVVASHQARFHVLNLHNLAIGRPTVEFRVFAGTLNFTKIAASIALCLGLVQRALDGREIPKWDYVKTAKQAADTREGAFATMRLMCSLNWRTLRGNPACGMLLGPGLPTRVQMRKMVTRLAKKYDDAIALRGY